MRYNDATPSLAQTIKMKKLSKEGKLDEDEIELIMSEEKANQVEKIKINKEKIQSVLPKKNMSQEEIENLIIIAIKEHIQRIKNKSIER